VSSAFVLVQVVLQVATATARGHPNRTPAEIVVDPRGTYQSISAAVANAPAGATIVLRAGTYREPTIRLDKPITLDGRGEAVLDGDGTHAIISITADDVTVRAVVLRHTGRSQTEDRAAVRAEGVRNCRIENSRVEDAFFAIYLARTQDCSVVRNYIRGSGATQGINGNGIHVWQSERVHVTGNRVQGQRDGIYFEFVKDGTIEDNSSTRNDRYGLHFMFSDDCRYQHNSFVDNGAGVAVMYTHRVRMLDNRFVHNWGGGAYGLLLKEISDSEIRRNHFVANSVGLYMEGSSRNHVEENEFRENGWALKLLADAQDNVVTHNAFEQNAFDVGTNSRQNFSVFRENYWDRYRGYDLDRNGIGDVPFAPVRLFALVVAQAPVTLILLRSAFVDLLDLAERVIPVVTPQTLVDARPLMRRPGQITRDSTVGIGPVRPVPAVATPLHSHGAHVAPQMAPQ
jgi:nitrous oxidase accessory protein